MKYSIIIPTMWMALSFFRKMLIEYITCDEIDEIIIIKNAELIDSDFSELLYSLKKVKIIDEGENLYVNPSWELGVQIAQNDRIILVNDDIFVYGIGDVLKSITLSNGSIIGFDKSCFRPYRPNKNEEIKKVKCNHHTLTWGFGVFMILHKQDYIPIPKELKVWYGDMFLFRQLKPYVIKGARINTPMQSTTSKMDLKAIKEKEKMYYRQNKHLFVHKK